MIAPDDSHKVTPELVLDVVSDHFNVSVSELKGSRRNARTAGARQIVMYLCRQMTDASLQSIGDLLGGRDHSTVNHGVDKIAQDVEKDETLRNTIEIIQKKTARCRKVFHDLPGKKKNCPRTCQSLKSFWIKALKYLSTIQQTLLR